MKMILERPTRLAAFHKQGSTHGLVICHDAICNHFSNVSDSLAAEFQITHYDPKKKSWVKIDLEDSDGILLAFIKKTWVGCLYRDLYETLRIYVGENEKKSIWVKAKPITIL